MKKNKTLWITVFLCLLPMAAGAILYDRLPQSMPIHFNIKNEVDKYADKNFVLFGLPILMAILQTICMLVGNYRIDKNGLSKPKVIMVFEWFIPILTIVLYTITLEVPLGSDVYVGKSICMVLGIIFVIIGNYMPKMSYETGKQVFHPTPKSEKSFRKMSKLFGYSFIGVGILLLLLVFFV